MEDIALLPGSHRPLSRWAVWLRSRAARERQRSVVRRLKRLHAAPSVGQDPSLHLLDEDLRNHDRKDSEAVILKRHDSQPKHLRYRAIPCCDRPRQASSCRSMASRPSGLGQSAIPTSRSKPATSPLISARAAVFELEEAGSASPSRSRMVAVRHNLNPSRVTCRKHRRLRRRS